MILLLKLVNGEEIQLTTEEKSIVVGRSSKCHVVIPHEGMSRQHLKLDHENGEVFITDLGSTNGVLINGERIPAHEKIKYATYLSLSFGAVAAMTVDMEDKTSPVFIPKSEPLSNFSANTDARTAQMKDVSHLEIALNKNGAKKASKPLPLKKKESSRAGPIGLNIIALLILLGTAYWYLSQDESTENLETTQEVQYQ